mmetsp:Transcript_16472/g.32789  ORF Transcript_16472/g.32789 Transcript_16472/m.32789 type:complete len:233 (+) Transcript_16472:246-944(+)
MSLVNVVGMLVLDNPCAFTNPFQFEITFDCLSPLPDDLEWKVTYVSSAEDSTLDQVLDEVMVGPVPVGTNKFVLQADPPDVSRIPPSDVLGVTVVLVTCSYKDAEFCRVGYYVNNEYSEPYDEEQGPPNPIDPLKVQRTILADKPRVTRFPIDWNLGAAAASHGQQQQQQQQQGSFLGGSGLPPSSDPSFGSPVPSLGAASTPSDAGATPLPGAQQAHGNFKGAAEPHQMEM